MKAENHSPVRKIRTLYNITRNEFHALLDSVSEEDWNKQSLNLGWSNGEIFAHILFGFIILNALLPMARMWGKLPRETSKPFAKFLNFFTKPFNWINALGARGQAKVFTYRRVGKIFDKTISSLISKLNSIDDDEWQTGMYYPTEWDPNFSEFMTLEKLFLYPVAHFKLHQNQIAH
ncbi:MAG: DinB family protein [Anaerolineales bacterium]